MVKHRKQLPIIGIFLLFLITAFDQIGNSFRVFNTMIEGSKICVIFKNESEQELLYDSGILSLNGQELDDTVIYPISESDIPLSTLFLVDVTKTVLYSETARVTEVAEVFSKNPVFSATGRSRYFLQTFGNVVSQVSGPSEDPILLVAGIKYEDNTSDYYYALSEAVDYLQNRIKDGYVEKQQIIIFTDAARYSETSIAESQLKDKLRKAGIPVYGIALYNTNTEMVDRTDTDRLLVLAEASGGTVLVPKDYSGSTTVMVNKIIGDIIACYTASANVNDNIARDPGGNYAVSLTIDYQNNRIAEIPYTASLKLPDLPTETPEPTDTPEPTETPTPEVTETPAPEDSGEEEENWFEKRTELFDHEISNKWIAICACGVILTAAVVTVILTAKNRKEKKKKLQEQQKVNEAAKLQANSKTMMAQMIPSINISLIRIGGQAVPPIQVKLRENEEVKFGRTPGKDVIGLDNDSTISAVHFKLVYMNGFIYIEDMASSNGVILNGTKLSQRARLNDGDHLLLGRITYRVQITTPNISVLKRG